MKAQKVEQRLKEIALVRWVIYKLLKWPTEKLILIWLVQPIILAAKKNSIKLDPDSEETQTLIRNIIMLHPIRCRIADIICRILFWLVYPVFDE